MARIVPTGADTFQYIEDDKEQLDIEVEQPRQRIGGPFENGIGQPLYTSGGYTAPGDRGWDIGAQEMTGPDTFQVTEWRNRDTGAVQSEAPKARYLSQEQWNAGMRDHSKGSGWGSDPYYYAGAGGGGGVQQQGAASSNQASPRSPGPPYEYGNERSGSSYPESATRQRVVEPRVQRMAGAEPPYEYGDQRDRPLVNGSRLEPRVQPSSTQYSIYGSQNYGRDRAEPKVTMGSREPDVQQVPQTIPMYVPDYNADPGYSIYGQQEGDPGYSIYGPMRSDPGYSIYGQQQPMPEPQVQPIISAIPQELQDWADEHGIQITQQQIDQYNAIQQGGWK